MKTNHTPGPWEVERARNGLPYRIVAPGGDDGKPGAVGKHITRWGAISLPSSEEGEANARLIAASPELLRIAERLADDDEVPTDGDMVIAILKRDAKAAIAKATGEDAP
jgi:hypothetical protein